jgi:hypothetical protein
MSVQAMKAGAVEFLTKPFRDQALLDAIHHAIQRDCANRKHQAEIAEQRARYNLLTQREHEVLRHPAPRTARADGPNCWRPPRRSGERRRRPLVVPVMTTDDRFEAVSCQSISSSGEYNADSLRTHR